MKKEKATEMVEPELQALRFWIPEDLGLDWLTSRHHLLPNKGLMLGLELGKQARA